MAHILVIDDEEEVLLAVSRRLAREGHEVTTAANSEQGIAKIRNIPQPFDVVITDMSMEQTQSGVEVIHAAFSRDLFAEVIVMTAYGNVANAVECMRRGAFDYVEKNQPGVDTFEVLTELVSRALSQRLRDARTIDLWERAAKSKERVPS
jgi:DNA-binding NtrC family response regulator